MPHKLKTRRLTHLRRVTHFLLASCLVFGTAGFAQLGSLGRSVLDWPTGVTVYNPAKAFNGYTVITPYMSDQSFLIDMKGRVVHTWYADPNDHSMAWFFERLPNGHWFGLLQAQGHKRAFGRPPGTTTVPVRDSDGSKDPPAEGNSAVAELGFNGRVIWKYSAPAGMVFTHDMARTPQGNTLVIGYVHRNLPSVSKRPIMDAWIVEVNQAKKVVWEWKEADHFDEFGFDAATKKLIYEQGGDIFHQNSIQVLPQNALASRDARFRPGNLLLSNWSNSLIFIVDRETGKIVWKWGEQRGGLVAQHDPSMLANGDILIYDDGGSAPYPPRHRSYTRLVEMNPITNRIVWQYMSNPYSPTPTGKFFSLDWGSVQRLPNGNTLSLDTHKGRIFEITPQGEIVWEYVSPFTWENGTRYVGHGIFRVYRYAYDDFPEVNQYFPETDGHLGYTPAKIPIPPFLGLPVPAQR